jgi:hypothetical protein
MRFFQRLAGDEIMKLLRVKRHRLNNHSDLIKSSSQ